MRAMSTATPPLEPQQPEPEPLAPPPVEPPPPSMSPRTRATIIASVIVAVVLIGLLIWGAVVLVQNPTQAAAVRDVFIILMALQAFVIGTALIVLTVQVAILTNLLKNELKPILEATQDTVRTVRGTAVFLSENVTEPVIRLNSYVAGLSKMVDTLNQLGGIFRRF